MRKKKGSCQKFCLNYLVNDLSQYMTQQKLLSSKKKLCGTQDSEVIIEYETKQ